MHPKKSLVFYLKETTNLNDLVISQEIKGTKQNFLSNVKDVL